MARMPDQGTTGTTGYSGKFNDLPQGLGTSIAAELDRDDKVTVREVCKALKDAGADAVNTIEIDLDSEGGFPEQPLRVFSSAKSLRIKTGTSFTNQKIKGFRQLLYALKAQYTSLTFITGNTNVNDPTDSNNFLKVFQQFLHPKPLNPGSVQANFCFSKLTKLHINGIFLTTPSANKILEQLPLLQDVSLSVYSIPPPAPAPTQNQNQNQPAAPPAPPAPRPPQPTGLYNLPSTIKSLCIQGPAPGSSHVLILDLSDLGNSTSSITHFSITNAQILNKDYQPLSKMASLETFIIQNPTADKASVILSSLSPLANLTTIHAPWLSITEDDWSSLARIKALKEACVAALVLPASGQASGVACLLVMDMLEVKGASEGIITELLPELEVLDARQVVPSGAQLSSALQSHPSLRKLGLGPLLPPITRSTKPTKIAMHAVDISSLPQLEHLSLTALEDNTSPDQLMACIAQCTSLTSLQLGMADPTARTHANDRTSAIPYLQRSSNSAIPYLERSCSSGRHIIPKGIQPLSHCIQVTSLQLPHSDCSATDWATISAALRRLQQAEFNSLAIDLATSHPSPITSLTTYAGFTATKPKGGPSSLTTTLPCLQQLAIGSTPCIYWLATLLEHHQNLKKLHVGAEDSTSRPVSGMNWKGTTLLRSMHVLQEFQVGRMLCDYTDDLLADIGQCVRLRRVAFQPCSSTWSHLPATVEAAPSGDVGFSTRGLKELASAPAIGNLQSLEIMIGTGTPRVLRIHDVFEFLGACRATGRMQVLRLDALVQLPDLPKRPGWWHKWCGMDRVMREVIVQGVAKVGYSCEWVQMVQMGGRGQQLLLQLSCGKGAAGMCHVQLGVAV